MGERERKVLGSVGLVRSGSIFIAFSYMGIGRIDGFLVQ